MHVINHQRLIGFNILHNTICLFRQISNPGVIPLFLSILIATMLFANMVSAFVAPVEGLATGSAREGAWVNMLSLNVPTEVRAPSERRRAIGSTAAERASQSAVLLSAFQNNVAVEWQALRGSDRRLSSW